MRETRTSGSEGGAAQPNALSLPLSMERGLLLVAFGAPDNKLSGPPSRQGEPVFHRKP